MVSSEPTSLSSQDTPRSSCTSQSYAYPLNSCSSNLAHPDETYTGVYNGCNTLWEGYQTTVKRIPDLPHLGTRDKVNEDGTRDYSWKTWREIYDLQNAFARGRPTSLFLVLYPNLMVCECRNVSSRILP